MNEPINMNHENSTDSNVPVKSNSGANTHNNQSMLWAVLAAIGASVCCVGPLVLLALGISGAWISYLTALEPYRPYFIAITLVFLFLAFRQLYIKPKVCELGKRCADPKVIRNQRIIFWVVSFLLIALVTFPYYGLALFE